MPRKLFAKAASIISMNRNPVEVKNEVKKVNSAIKRIENSEIDAATYLKKISTLGASLFEALAITKSQKQILGSIGSKLAGATVFEDMRKDLSKDRRNGSFNPLKGSSPELLNHLAKKYVGDFRELVDPIIANMPVIPQKIGFLRRARLRLLKAITLSTDEDDCCETCEAETGPC
jgi:hypothetical protein